jgi:hypothetical protein
LTAHRGCSTAVLAKPIDLSLTTSPAPQDAGLSFGGIQRGFIPRCR